MIENVIERAIVPHNPSAARVLNKDKYNLFAPIAGPGKVGMASFAARYFSVKNQEVSIKDGVIPQIINEMEGADDENALSAEYALQIFAQLNGDIENNTTNIELHAQEIGDLQDDVYELWENINLIFDKFNEEVYPELRDLGRAYQDANARLIVVETNSATNTDNITTLSGRVDENTKSSDNNFVSIQNLQNEVTNLRSSFEGLTVVDKTMVSVGSNIPLSERVLPYGKIKKLAGFSVSTERYGNNSFYAQGSQTAENDHGTLSIRAGENVNAEILYSRELVFNGPAYNVSNWFAIALETLNMPNVMNTNDLYKRVKYVSGVATVEGYDPSIYRIMLPGFVFPVITSGTYETTGVDGRSGQLVILSDMMQNIPPIVFDNYTVEISYYTKYKYQKPYKIKSYDSIGRNLIKYPYKLSTMTRNGLTYTVLADGGIQVTGIVEAGKVAPFNFTGNEFIHYLPMGTYAKTPFVTIVYRDTGGELRYINPEIAVFTLTQDIMARVYLQNRLYSTDTSFDQTLYPMLCRGDLPVGFELYHAIHVDLPDEVLNLSQYGIGNLRLHNYIDIQNQVYHEVCYTPNEISDSIIAYDVPIQTSLDTILGEEYKYIPLSKGGMLVFYDENGEPVSGLQELIYQEGGAQ